MFLRQSTSQVVRIGPFVDSTDGVTPETGLTINNTDVDISKDGGAFASKNSGGLTADGSNGWYSGTFDATDTATVGILEVEVTVAGALPVFKTYYVVEENIYDAYFAASAAAGTDIAAILVDTAEIGAAGAGLTDLGGMSTTMKAQVNTEVDSAFTTQMADSVSTDGTIATREQALYMILQLLTEFAISSTTMTVKKVDGSTSLMTLTLDDATNPTSITRAT